MSEISDLVQGVEITPSGSLILQLREKKDDKQNFIYETISKDFKDYYSFLDDISGINSWNPKAEALQNNPRRGSMRDVHIEVQEREQNKEYAKISMKLDGKKMIIDVFLPNVSDDQIFVQKYFLEKNIEKTKQVAEFFSIRYRVEIAKQNRTEKTKSDLFLGTTNGQLTTPRLVLQEPDFQYFQQWYDLPKNSALILYIPRYYGGPDNNPSIQNTGNHQITNSWMCPKIIFKQSDKNIDPTSYEGNSYREVIDSFIKLKLPPDMPKIIFIDSGHKELKKFIEESYGTVETIAKKKLFLK